MRLFERRPQQGRSEVDEDVVKALREPRPRLATSSLCPRPTRLARGCPLLVFWTQLLATYQRLLWRLGIQSAYGKDLEQSWMVLMLLRLRPRRAEYSNFEWWLLAVIAHR